MASIDDSKFQRLVGQIYDAALEPEKWSTFIASYADACGVSAALHFEDPMAATGMHISVAARLDPTWLKLYETHYSKIRPWLSKAAHAPVGRISSVFAWIDEPAYRSSLVYNESLARADVHYQLGGVLQRDGNICTCISVTRPLRAGDFTASDFKLTEKLVPHLQRALQIHRRLVAGKLRNEALLRGLEGLGLGIIVAASDARVLFANGIADAILRRGDGLCARRERLHASTPSVTNELQRYIHEAACTGAKLAQHSGGALRVPCLGSGELSLRVCPFPIDLGIVIGPTVPMALIFLADSSDRRPPRLSDLKTIYGLTAAESRLLGALLTGLSLDEYAQVCRISLATAKTQLRHVFHKTGQSRQSDLVRHVLSNPLMRFAPLNG